MERIAYSLSIITTLLALVLSCLIPWILISKRLIAVSLLVLGASTVGWGVALVLSR